MKLFNQVDPGNRQWACSCSVIVFSHFVAGTIYIGVQNHWQASCYAFIRGTRDFRDIMNKPGVAGAVLQTSL